MAAKTESPFGPALVRFLADLEGHNTRRWFAANKARYEAEVREPALAFIRAMAPHVVKLSDRLLAVDKQAGGSLMRIHRDVRFSKDKSPYKTNLGIQFRHEDGKDVHAPGLYFHVDPKSVFLGAGMWHPDREPLEAVRAAIVRDPKAWKRVRDAKRFRDHFTLDAGDALKRAPKGVDPEHPMIDDLRKKDHIAVCHLAHAELAKSGLVELVADRFRRAKDYMAWQAQAVGLPF